MNLHNTLKKLPWTQLAPMIIRNAETTLAATDENVCNLAQRMVRSLVEEGTTLSYPV